MNGEGDCSWDDTKNVSFQTVWDFLSGIFIFFEKKSIFLKYIESLFRIFLYKIDKFKINFTFIFIVFDVV